MFVSADWVLPVDGPPIRGGVVRVSGDRVADVGPAERTSASGEERVDLPGRVLLPGLVNAHTHLVLTALAGRVPPSDFPDWLGALVPHIQAMDDADRAASAALGARRCLESGVTVVGDIAYGPESREACAALGVGGVFFREVIAATPEDLPVALDGVGCAATARQRDGVSPHSPYSVGPELLRASVAFARVRELPIAVHVAESPAESRLLRDGTGPLAEVTRRLVPGFTPPDASPVAYLAGLGVLDGALAIHCVQLEPGDAETLAGRSAGVALCPRSNALLGNGAPPVAALVEAGAIIAVGTDSAASNRDLDLMAEARALWALAPSLPPERLLRVITLDGARSLGVGDAFGSLAPGKQADLVAVRVDAGDDPLAAVLEAGGAATIDAVMTAGVWRLRR